MQPPQLAVLLPDGQRQEAADSGSVPGPSPPAAALSCPVLPCLGMLRRKNACSPGSTPESSFLSSLTTTQHQSWWSPPPQAHIPTEREGTRSRKVTGITSNLRPGFGALSISSLQIRNPGPENLLTRPQKLPQEEAADRTETRGGFVPPTGLPVARDAITITQQT